MMTIEQFGRRLRARELTSVRTTEECLRRIEADNPRLNAFIRVMGDEALQQARQADQELTAGQDRGPLHGVPISIKDLLDIRGIPTTAASRVRDGHVAERDAQVIAHLRMAGAVFVGKTNLHEFAFGTTSEDRPRNSSQCIVHGLSDPDDARHAYGRRGHRGGRRTAGSLWPERGRRAAVAVVHRGCSGRSTQRNRTHRPPGSHSPR